MNASGQSPPVGRGLGGGDGDAEAPARPLRADAQRNRALVLSAAEEIFAAEGLDVPIDEVARRAGLGVGTLYRHFPSKEALFEAILLDRLETLVAVAEELAGADNPGEALYSFMATLGAQVAHKRDLADALTRAGIDIKAVAGEGVTRLEGALAVLLERAQAAGAVRGDVEASDLFLLVAGTCTAAEQAGDPQVLARVLRIVTEGLRPRSPDLAPTTAQAAGAERPTGRATD